MTAAEIVRLLNLEPLPQEGGYFARTYTSSIPIPGPALPPGFNCTARLAGSAIYYLITTDTFSRLHRVRSDELFHHYAGDPVRQVLFPPGGAPKERILGNDLASGQRPQGLVPAGYWQGATLAPAPRHGWALLGCTVTPGFEYTDFELANRAALLEHFPALRPVLDVFLPA